MIAVHRRSEREARTLRRLMSGACARWETVGRRTDTQYTTIILTLYVILLISYPSKGVLRIPLVSCSGCLRLLVHVYSRRVLSLRYEFVNPEDDIWYKIRRVH